MFPKNKKSASPTQVHFSVIDGAETRTHSLKPHFDRAVELLKARRAVLSEIKTWRAEARAEGLDPTALLRLAREHLFDADQRRKAAERAEVEELYRQGLGLPLFDHATGAAR
jgi:hypothetical protein